MALAVGTIVMQQENSGTAHMMDKNLFAFFRTQEIIYSHKIPSSTCRSAAQRTQLSAETPRTFAGQTGFGQILINRGNQVQEPAALVL